MISPEHIQQVREALTARAEAVCRELLKGGKKSGQTWQCGGVDGGPGKSMGIELSGPKAGVWHDRATGEAGDLLELFKVTGGLSFSEAVDAAMAFCSMAEPIESDWKIDPSDFQFNPPAAVDEAPTYKVSAPTTTLIDWKKCVAEFTPDKAAELCEWRGYSVEFVQWMREQELIGCFQGAFAFPVHNSKGQVVAIHHKSSDGWRYYPSGAESAPLLVGIPSESVHCLAFESQWDAFAVLDKLNAHHPENSGIYSAYITRSATSNTDISKLAITNLIAVNQNDPKEKLGKDGVIRANTNKEGRTPSEEWLHRISTSRNKITQFAVFETPEPHKDANDWIRVEHPEHHQVFFRVIEQSKNPILKGTMAVNDLVHRDSKNDPDALIGYEKRFLSKGGSWMIIGPSGIGKSTLITSLCIHAAAGVNWHGLTFRHPLKTFVVQAENDPGDLGEMLHGAIADIRFRFSKTEFSNIGKNLYFKQVTDKTGEKFVRWLEEFIRETQAQLVIIDPLLSFVGDDISQQKVASKFFRELLQPVLERTGAIVVLVHHTGKPSRDKDAQKGWNSSDFSYIGLGSSEIVNWPRAVSVLIHTKQEKTFLFKNCKRGNRAGMVDQFKGYISEDIYLKHSTGGELSWEQVRYDEPEEEEKPYKGKGESGKSSVKPELFLPLIPACCTYKDIYDLLTKSGGLSGPKAKGMITDMLMARMIIKGDDGFYRKPEVTLFD